MHGNGEKHTVALKGYDIRCFVRRRKNQKYINLRITIDGEILVSAPYGVGIAKIAESLRKKEHWIERNLVKVAAGRARFDPMRSLFFFGVTHDVEVLHDPRRKRSITISRESRRIEIRTGDTSRRHVLAILKSRLEGEAKRYFPTRAVELSTSTGMTFARMFIRNQRTRWGSSSAKGNISVNWRAIMLPPAVQDYLIIHELAHQVHLNHSKAFWAVVECHFPGYRAANRWLRDHSLLISLFR